MSGNSYSQDCPRCLGKDTLMCNNDSRPHETINGECVCCGYFYYTNFSRLDKDTLKQIRKDYGYKNKKLTKKQLENIKDFDLNYGVKE